MRRFSIGHGYDPECDPTQWPGHNPTKLNHTRSPERQAFAYSRLSAANREVQRSRPSQDRVRREEAERNAAEAVRQAVAVLEMALHELNQVRAPADYDKSVNQKQIHNGVFHLKTKCGVAFDRDEFSSRVTLNR